jgi:hypothetical protein
MAGVDVIEIIATLRLSKINLDGRFGAGISNNATSASSLKRTSVLQRLLPIPEFI